MIMKLLVIVNRSENIISNCNRFSLRDLLEYFKDENEACYKVLEKLKGHLEIFLFKANISIQDMIDLFAQFLSDISNFKKFCHRF